MNVLYHPDFPRDLGRFSDNYLSIYPALEERFNREVDEALAEIKAGPQYAGHLLKTEISKVKSFRRRNLRTFPFFVLYGHEPELVIFGSLVPSRSDPLTWLARFKDWPGLAGT